MLAVVTKTGANTYIGRAANLMAATNDPGHFQQIVGNIGNFLIIISLVSFCLVLAPKLNNLGDVFDFIAL